MPKNLVIVESPAKARTIERYLGDDYRVLASYGHVRDLPENPGKGKFGVDVDNDFAPEYVISDDRKKQVAEITKAAKSADMVYLATDLDREGEAIAWHVVEAAHVPASKTQRVTFSEITESAIREAFAHPRQIDTNLVDAQQTRRIVDRLVGYTLSPLLARKVRAGLSAGRVQSVAVRLVVEREREIDAFTAREYWTLEASLATADGTTFPAEVVRIDGAALDVGDGDTAERHAAALRELTPARHEGRDAEADAQPGAAVHDLDPPAGGQPQARLQPEADDVDRPAPVRGRRHAGRPRRAHHLHANGLHRDGRRRHGRGARRHPRRASVSRTRCPRAASTRPRQRAPRRRTSRSAQPVSSASRSRWRARSSRRSSASTGSIWQRAIASQMAAKEMETTSIELSAGPYDLRASATRTLFDGFSRVYTEGRDDDAVAEDEEDRRLPPLAEGDPTTVTDVTPTQHFTEPPPRFTEATLIKALEEHGIGRPSTYAATISTIVDRGYVAITERRLHPEIVAGIVTDLLVEHFGDYVDLAFTARMEEELDEIARGEREWVPLLRAFYGPLRDRVDEKRKVLKRGRLHDRADATRSAPRVIRW